MYSRALIVASVMAFLDLGLSDAYWLVKNAMHELNLNHLARWNMYEYKKIIQTVRLAHLEKISQDIDF